MTTKSAQAPSQSARLTKIVATVGPASSSPEILERLIAAGVDAFRLNFSHGNHDQHGETYRAIRSAARKLSVPTAILQDISGPKLRIGELQDGSAILPVGSKFNLVKGLETGDASQVGFEDTGWFGSVGVGERVVLGDGDIVLRTVGKREGVLECEVLAGGLLKSRWGLNFPDSRLRLGAVTAKDRRDLEFGASLGMDIVAVSFVQSPKDIRQVREILGATAAPPLVIAKIELPSAVERVDEILDEADGLMVARGDLGLTIPLEQVPTVQKMLIRKCRARGKVVITATQMLESMTSNLQPTRAEVTDVANAVYDGTDAVMLSGETAAGSHPVLVVETMARILREAEPHVDFRELPQTDGSVEGAVAAAAVSLARELGAKAVLVPFTGGSTAQRISRLRPGVPIVAGVGSAAVLPTLNLWSSVYPIPADPKASLLKSLSSALDFARRNGWLAEGDRAVATGGFPMSRRGVTNFVRAVVVGEEL